MSQPNRPLTDRKIPGTDVPDVTQEAPADAAQSRWMSRVGVTTAVLAAGASISTMFSASNLNKAMLDEIQASDTWSEYQSKGIKLAIVETRIETMGAASSAKPNRLAGEDDDTRAARYKKEQQDLKAQAEGFQDSSRAHGARHTRLSLASTAYQIAIALAAVALLVRRNVFWMISLGIGVVGTLLFAVGMLA